MALLAVMALQAVMAEQADMAEQAVSGEQEDIGIIKDIEPQELDLPTFGKKSTKKKIKSSKKF